MAQRTIPTDNADIFEKMMRSKLGDGQVTRFPSAEVLIYNRLDNDMTKLALDMGANTFYPWTKDGFKPMSGIVVSFE